MNGDATFSPGAPTFEMLRDAACETHAGRIFWRNLNWKFNKPSYEEWSALVEDAVLFELGNICERKNDFHDLDEDALSGVLNVALCSLALDASGGVFNGNCDVKIKRDDYVWLGEAKIAGNTSHIHGGYLQLRNRYASGIPEHNRGGMLIFCQDEPTDVVMAGWRAALEMIVPNSNPTDHVTSPFAFTSIDKAPGTNQPLRLIHIAFPLFHKPLDPDATLPADAALASRRAKAAVKKRALATNPSGVLGAENSFS